MVAAARAVGPQRREVAAWFPLDAESAVNEVSFQQVVASAEQRRAALPCELAAYLTLAITEQAATFAATWDSGEIWLTEDGRLRVGAGQHADQGLCERSIRALLAWMLTAASSVSPALLRISRAEHQSGLDGLTHELETALIPVNRGAARRALARLYREVQRAVELGLNPPISRPPDHSCRDGASIRQEVSARQPPPVEERSVASSPPPVDEASLGADDPAEGKSSELSGSDAIPDLEIPGPSSRNEAIASQGTGAEADPSSPYPLRTVRLDEVHRGAGGTGGYLPAGPATAEVEPAANRTEPLKISACVAPCLVKGTVAAETLLERQDEIVELDPEDVVEVQTWSDTAPPVLAMLDSVQEVAAETVDIDVEIEADVAKAAWSGPDDPLPFDTWLDAPVETVVEQPERCADLGSAPLPDADCGTGAVPSQPVVPLAQPYSAPARFPRHASKVEDLTAGFTVSREPASPDLSGDLRRAAGIDPTGSTTHLRSETPPPAIREAADPESDQSGRHFGTRTLLGLGGAVTAMAAVALMVLRGNLGLLPAAAAAPVPTTESTETCSAAVRVLQVDPGVLVRAREADEAGLRLGRHTSPSEVRVEGLRCGVSAELLLYGPRPGILRRIPIDGGQLQPSAKNPVVEAMVIAR